MKPAVGIGSPAKAAAEGLVAKPAPLLNSKKESTVVMAMRAGTAPTPASNRLGPAKRRSPPQAPNTAMMGTGAAGTFQKKTLSLVSYSSEDSDSDADA